MLKQAALENPIVSTQEQNQILLEILSQEALISEYEIPDTSKERSSEKLMFGGKKAKSWKYDKKSIENCRRTARIVIISCLGEVMDGKKQLKKLLGDILLNYKEKKAGSTAEEKEPKIGYYDSINYGRIRICHNEFIKHIICNTRFQPFILKLFQNKETLLQSKKIRKHKRASIPKEERIKILETVLKEYQNILVSHIKTISTENHEDQNQIQEQSDPSQGDFLQSHQEHTENVKVEEKSVFMGEKLVRFPFCYAPNLAFRSFEEQEKCLSMKNWHFWMCQSTQFFEFSRDFGNSFVNLKIPFRGF